MLIFKSSKLILILTLFFTYLLFATTPATLKVTPRNAGGQKAKKSASKKNNMLCPLIGGRTGTGKDITTWKTTLRNAFNTIQGSDVCKKLSTSYHNLVDKLTEREMAASLSGDRQFQADMIDYRQDMAQKAAKARGGQAPPEQPSPHRKVASENAVSLASHIAELIKNDCAKDDRAMFGVLYGVSNVVGAFVGGATSGGIALGTYIASAVKQYYEKRAKDRQDVDKSMFPIELACMMKAVSSIDFKAKCARKLHTRTPDNLKNDLINNYLPALDNLNDPKKCSDETLKKSLSSDEACDNEPHEIINTFMLSFPKIYLSVLKKKHDNGVALCKALIASATSELSDEMTDLATSVRAKEDALTISSNVDEVYNIMDVISRGRPGNTWALNKITDTSSSLLNNYFTRTLNETLDSLRDEVSEGQSVVNGPLGIGNRQTDRTEGEVLSDFEAIGDICDFFKCEIAGKSSHTNDPKDNPIRSSKDRDELKNKCSETIQTDVATKKPYDFSKADLSECPNCSHETFNNSLKNAIDAHYNPAPKGREKEILDRLKTLRTEVGKIKKVKKKRTDYYTGKLKELLPDDPSYKEYYNKLREIMRPIEDKEIEILELEEELLEVIEANKKDA